MENNQNNPRNEGLSQGRPKYKLHDDYNILEPGPDSDIQFLWDEDNGLSDFTLMKKEGDQY